MSIEVIVRYVDGHKETKKVVESATVRVLRTLIRKERPELQSKRLKLLANGRVITNNTRLSGGPRVFIDCIIGGGLSEEELALEDGMDVQPERSTTEQRGFDRLLSQGFSDGEVNDLRRQFIALHGGETQDTREMEEAWMDSSVGEPPNNTMPVSTTSNGEWGFLIGVLAGFCLGGLSLILIHLQVGGVFSKKHQMAIVCGACINLAFSLLLVWS